MINPYIYAAKLHYRQEMTNVAYSLTGDTNILETEKLIFCDPVMLILEYFVSYICILSTYNSTIVLLYYST